MNQKKPSVLLRRSALLGPLLCLVGFGPLEQCSREKEREEIFSAIRHACGAMRPYYDGCGRGNTCVEATPWRSATCSEFFRDDDRVRSLTRRLHCSIYDLPGDEFRIECRSPTITVYLFAATEGS